jgi:hypothetical protein
MSVADEAPVNPYASSAVAAQVQAPSQVSVGLLNARVVLVAMLLGTAMINQWVTVFAFDFGWILTANLQWSLGFSVCFAALAMLPIGFAAMVCGEFRPRSWWEIPAASCALIGPPSIQFLIIALMGDWSGGPALIFWEFTAKLSLWAFVLANPLVQTSLFYFLSRTILDRSHWVAICAFVALVLGTGVGFCHVLFIMSRL